MLAPRAEIAFSVFRNLETQCDRAQVRDLTKKVDRRFRVAILQFSVGGAHAAQRANSTIDTFGNSFSLPGAHLQKKSFPTFLHAPRTDVIGILVGQHADAHMPIGIESEGIYSATAGI